MDRYVVVVVSKHTGTPYQDGGIFVGDEGAEEAAQRADSWNAKHPWAAFVVGLHEGV